MVTTVASQLPSSTSTYERVMAQVLDTRERLRDGLTLIPAIGITDVPDDWLPWLILNYGLESIYPIIGDARLTLTEGRQWQRIRGTNAATEKYVLPWLGLVGLEIPDRAGKTGPIEEVRLDDVKSYWYQIGLAEPPASRQQLELLVQGDLLSKDAGSDLARIYGGYDIRAFRLDRSRLERAMLDDWSGVFLPGIKPKLSFGRYYSGSVRFAICATGSARTDRAVAARFRRGFVLDRSKLDREVVNQAVVRISTASITDTLTLVKGSRVRWPRRKWPHARWVDIKPTIYGGLDGTLGN